MFPILTSMLVLSEPRLSRRITWNLSGFTIILLLWSQLITASFSDYKIGINSLNVLAKLAKVLSTAKLWTEAFGIKKKKLLKKIGSKIEPWGTPDMTVSNSLYLFEHIVYGLLNKNKCSKANHYLDHMLRVLRSISRVVCSQKL